MRIAILCLSVLALLGVVVPATAGDYYYHSGYNGYRGGNGNVYYTSSCCYKKVVRHVTTSHYVRIYDGYNRGSGYYDGSYRSSYYDQPRRYVDDNYYAPPRRYVGYDNGGYSGYPGYAAYGQSCSYQRVRVEDGRGGWVWSSTRVCN